MDYSQGHDAAKTANAYLSPRSSAGVSTQYQLVSAPQPLMSGLDNECMGL